MAFAAAAPAAAFLPGCRTVPGAGECDLPSVTGIDWVLPDIARPVSHSRFDPEPVFTPEAARVVPNLNPPRPMLIYHPAAARGGRLLRPCLSRYPVVLFLHGDRGLNIPAANFHARWHRLPSTLARCGYVVVVPSHTASADPSDADAAAALRDLAWVRESWVERAWLDQRPDGVLFMGHSRGALLAARLAAQHPCMAFASLGGGFLATPSFIAQLRAITVPSFFMFLDSDSPGASNENLESGGVFDSLPQPKWKAVYAGRHFDYLDAADTADEERGPCSLIPQLSADLVTLFAGASVASLTSVEPSLRRPEVSLTPAQQAFATGHLRAESQLAGQRDCQVTLSWVTPNDTGTRILGVP